MRKIIIIILLIASCKSKDTSTYFDALKGRSEVEITLKEFNLNYVPSDIKVLKGVKRLYLRLDKGWTIYPPLSALPKNEGHAEKVLPRELADLISLRSLSLSGLGLTSLPSNFGNLVNLDSLFMYANHLTIAAELDKLGKLKRLKYLGLLGNHVTPGDLQQLHKMLPEVVINPELR